jgi:hypothetical protein
MWGKEQERVEVARKGREGRKVPEHLSYLQVRSRGRADDCSVASCCIVATSCGTCCCFVATSGGSRCCVVATSGDLAHQAVQPADEVGAKPCGADGVIAAWQVDRGLDR